jgi:hypothetical protein
MLRTFDTEKDDFMVVICDKLKAKKLDSLETFMIQKSQNKIKIIASPDFRGVFHTAI